MNNLIQQLRKFASERQWEQFHSPKNLTMAISIEAAELMEHFQWLTEAQ
ncbi:MAG TPA: nucleotide pyrophosphohydrolase, partial [Candidatus Latescibacteria bacterium]|nr:nucleotide pyrophosphohydrolase [Candidatus Latescibacterota bacterium]